MKKQKKKHVWLKRAAAFVLTVFMATAMFSGVAFAGETDSADISDAAQAAVSASSSSSSSSTHQTIKNSAAYDKTGGVYDREGAYSILAMVNNLRSSVGAGSLAWDSDLEATALVRAKELATSFSHTRPDGTGCFTAFPTDSLSGENIAMGTAYYVTPSLAYTMWYNSSGHYYNMVYSGYNSIGIACYVYGGCRYYVQCFGGDEGDGQRFTTASSTASTLKMLRLYNSNSGEHFYTSNAYERDTLVYAGWTYEGVAWTAPKSSKKPVYRMYNKNAGDHHYTTSATERDTLVKAGWTYEGIGWYSDDSKGAVLYRLYNPNATGAGSHHYTTSASERNYLVSLGWRNEGIGWYGVK